MRFLVSLLSSHQRVLVPPPCVQQYHAAFANNTLFPRALLGFISNWFDFSLWRDTRHPPPHPPPSEVRRRVFSRSADPALLSFITTRVFAFSINCQDHAQRLQKQPPALCATLNCNYYATQITCLWVFNCTVRLIMGRELKALLNSLIEQIAAPFSLKVNEGMVKRRTGNYSQLPQLICIAPSFQRGCEHIRENTDMPGGASRNIAGAFGQISFSRFGDSERLMSWNALEELTVAPCTLQFS